MILLFLVGIAIPVSAEMSVSPAPDKVDLYEPVFIEISLPYIKGRVTDPAEADIKVIFTFPDGSERHIPAFCLSNNKFAGSRWEARFTPFATGTYSYFVSADPGAAYRKSARYGFEVVNAAGDGFLRGCPDNINYLEFDSGKPFFGIGHNVAWVHNSSPKVFERYFSLMKKAGCNLSRIWICDWSFPLEWGKLGEYSEVSSEKLDETLKVAAEKGIYVILCLDTYGSLMEEPGPWGEGKWAENPYNAANGGPCGRPSEFFTNLEAKRLYRNRLRYIVSRWGYSTSILAFELWNEYNAPAEWTKEMASYIKAIDPAGHLVTTSLGYPHGDLFDGSLIWKIDEIDMVTFHDYGLGAETDLITPLMQKSRKVWQEYAKPFISSEFGIDSGKDDKNYDPHGKGTALHNSLWASLVSGSFGSAMNWWYDTYIRPKNLYGHYKALAEFTAGIDWCSGNVEHPRVSALKLKSRETQNTHHRDISIRPADKWGRIDGAIFTVLNNGDLAGSDIPVRYLHGWKKKEMMVDHIYQVDYPQDGKFVIHVGTVSQGGKLNVFLDGEKVVEREFPAGPGEGPWKSSTYVEKYDIYQCVYDEPVEVPVPGGEHSIKLSNTGEDWIGIEKITLIDYARSGEANARCLALTVGENSMVWIQNKESNWKNTYLGVEPEPVKGSYFEIYGLDDGTYDVEWWDTYSGGIKGKEKIRNKDGKMTVEVPEFDRDIACKISKK
jgi:hypothetical protein